MRAFHALRSVNGSTRCLLRASPTSASYRLARRAHTVSGFMGAGRLSTEPRPDDQPRGIQLAADLLGNRAASIRIAARLSEIVSQQVQSNEVRVTLRVVDVLKLPV